MEEYQDLVRGFLSERAYAFRIRSGLTQEVMAERMPPWTQVESWVWLEMKIVIPCS